MELLQLLDPFFFGLSRCENPCAFCWLEDGVLTGRFDFDQVDCLDVDLLRHIGALVADPAHLLNLLHALPLLLIGLGGIGRYAVRDRRVRCALLKCCPVSGLSAMLLRRRVLSVQALK